MDISVTITILKETLGNLFHSKLKEGRRKATVVFAVSGIRNDRRCIKVWINVTSLIYRRLGNKRITLIIKHGHKAKLNYKLKPSSQCSKCQVDLFCWNSFLYPDFHSV